MDKVLPVNGIETDRQTEQEPRHFLNTSPCEESGARLTNEAIRAQLLAEHICWHDPCLFCAFLNGEPIPVDQNPLAYDDLTPANRADLRALINDLRRAFQQRRALAKTDDRWPTPTPVTAARAARTAAYAARAHDLADRTRLLDDRNQWVERSRHLLAVLRATTLGEAPPKARRLSLVPGGARS
jgi:hypothetical protein